MNMNWSLPVLAIIAAVAISTSSTLAAQHSIDNPFLTVTYDDAAQTFSAKEKATGR
jgi:hypothetical protein